MSELNEIAAKLKNIDKHICCTNTFNELGQIELTDTDTQFFEKNSVHSISWTLADGASISLSINGGTPVTYSVDGAIEFSMYNKQSLLFTAIDANSTIIWSY